MITTRPDIRPDDRLSPTQAAVKLGISRKTIYDYEKRGYIKPYFRRATKTRFYIGSDLIKLWNQTF